MEKTKVEKLAGKQEQSKSNLYGKLIDDVITGKSRIMANSEIPAEIERTKDYLQSLRESKKESTHVIHIAYPDYTLTLFGGEDLSKDWLEIAKKVKEQKRMDE